jgi:hypothetical protein
MYFTGDITQTGGSPGIQEQRRFLRNMPFNSWKLSKISQTQRIIDKQFEIIRSVQCMDRFIEQNYSIQSVKDVGEVP